MKNEHITGITNNVERLFEPGINENSSQEDLEKAARNGNSGACLYLASRYVDNNTDEAIKWYRKGADLRNPFCMSMLASMVEANPDEAISLHRQAIQGLTDIGVLNMAAISQRRLGLLLIKKGGAYTEEGYTWIKKAAEAGDGDAQNALGVAYLKGIGCEKDPQQAVYWLRKAIAQDVYQAFDSLVSPVGSKGTTLGRNRSLLEISKSPTWGFAFKSSVNFRVQNHPPSRLLKGVRS